MTELKIKDSFNIFWRIAIIFGGATGLWLFMLRFNEMQPDAGYNPFIHLISALFIFVLASALVVLVHKFLDRRPWSERQFLRKAGGCKSFILGISCWLIPAAAGVLLSVMSGWTHISLQAPISTVVWKLLFLIAVVFLMEAFPEELVFRGYIYTGLNTVFPHWLAVLLQTVLFTLFAFFIGAIYSTEQLLFIPGFGFLLGFFRVLTRDIWFSIGFHLALMTATQLLSPGHKLFAVSGQFFALHFFSFILLPSIASSVILHFVYGNPDWNAHHQDQDT